MQTTETTRLTITWASLTSEIILYGDLTPEDADTLVTIVAWYLEEVDPTSRDTAWVDLIDHATEALYRWGVYPGRPLPDNPPSLQSVVETARTIGT